jgi:hypothetical protein
MILHVSRSDRIEGRLMAHFRIAESLREGLLVGVQQTYVGACGDFRL